MRRYDWSSFSFEEHPSDDVPTVGSGPVQPCERERRKPVDPRPTVRAVPGGGEGCDDPGSGPRWRERPVQDEVQDVAATAACPPATVVARNLEEWRGVVLAHHLPVVVDVPGGGPFSGTLTARTFDALVVREFEARPHVVAQTSPMLADDGYYKFGVQLDGYSLFCQDGREAALTPGDLAFCDATRPYELVFRESFRMLTVMFPQAWFSFGPDTMSHFTATRFSGRGGAGPLIAQTLRDVVRRVAEPTGPQAQREIARTVVGLLSGYVGARCAEEITALAAPETLFSRATEFIAAHLADPQLTPAAAARSQHVSLRLLQREFAAHSTSVAGWIREQRLERCRRDLERSDGRIPVGEVGARWGLIDAGTFSKAFKAAYGASPREYRIVHRATMQQPG
jgi:AraC-like DNA-binding protein